MDFLRWLGLSLFGGTAGDINTLAQIVDDAFTYEDNRITEVSNYLTDYEQVANNQLQYDISVVMDVIRTIINTMTAIVLVNIANLRQYVDRRIDDLSSRVDSQLSWFSRIISLLEFTLRLLISGVRDWVESAIAGPLWAALNGFIKWATGQIWHILQYFLHPELLVKLIAGYLWQAWIGLLHAFAVPIARYLMRTMFALKDEFVGILLDVLADII